MEGNNIFPSLLEKVILDIWGRVGECLDTPHLKKTRKAVTFIRRVYRHKGEHGTIQPSKINFKFKKNRAGYLAAFGERHAYLPYLHLKKVQEKNPEAIPKLRGKRQELVITSLGAGACIELYGICLFYLSDAPRQPLRLTLNSVEKEREWSSSQHVIFTRVLKETFPKVDVDPIDINADLKEDAIPKFVVQYDSLIRTDILLIYNVLNEIPSTYVKQVWRNIRFLIDIFQRPVLILIMEPSASRAEPRIYQIKEQIVQQTDLIEESKEEIFYFDKAPIYIRRIESENDLNYRLFGNSINGPGPDFETSISRAHMSCAKIPDSPITFEQTTSQIVRLGKKRGRRGEFSLRHNRVGRQYTFGSVSDNWKL